MLFVCYVATGSVEQNTPLRVSGEYIVKVVL